MNQRYVAVDGTPYMEWWRELFGTPADTFAESSFWQRGRSSIWVAARGVDPGKVSPVEGVGIPFLRIGEHLWKPTSVAVVEFGVHATRNVVALDAAECRRYLDRESLELAPDDPRGHGVRRGFAIVTYEGVPLGCGLWRRGLLESCVPKGRRLADVDLPIRR